MFILWGKNHSLTGGSGLYKPKASLAVLKIPRLNTLEKAFFKEGLFVLPETGFFITNAGSFLTLMVHS